MRIPLAWRLLAGVAVPALLSCTPDTTAPVQQIDVSKLFSAVTLDHHAVTLSLTPPYDTFRLTATLRAASGDPMPASSTPPHFASTDLERVSVDGDGLLHARAVGLHIAVVASDTIQDIVHTDTTWVNVNDVTPVPTLATLTIQPVPPDSAKWGLTGTILDELFRRRPTVRARAYDAAGDSISDLVVHYTSSDPNVATIDPLTGAVTPTGVGQTTFIATAVAYGVPSADTLPFTIGSPLSANIVIGETVDASGKSVVEFPASPTIIAPGGAVMWSNFSSTPVDVTFDDSSHVLPDDAMCAAFGSSFPQVACGSGNIDGWTADTTGNQLLDLRIRRFPIPGTYHYHSRLQGASGTIIAQ